MRGICWKNVSHAIHRTHIVDGKTPIDRLAGSRVSQIDVGSASGSHAFTSKPITLFRITSSAMRVPVPHVNALSAIR